MLRTVRASESSGRKADDLHHPVLLHAYQQVAPCMSASGLTQRDYCGHLRFIVYGHWVQAIQFRCSRADFRVRHFSSTELPSPVVSLPTFVPAKNVRLQHGIKLDI